MSRYAKDMVHVMGQVWNISALGYSKLNHIESAIFRPAKRVKTLAEIVLQVGSSKQNSGAAPVRAGIFQ